MFTRMVLGVVALAACCLLTSQAANVRQDGMRNRRTSQNEGYITRDASSMSSLQPYESLEMLQSKHGSLPFDPLSTAASYHHKKGSKGWLDMGAWTKKKGAFGWYADYPVGKGR